MIAVGEDQGVGAGQVLGACPAAREGNAHLTGNQQGLVVGLFQVAERAQVRDREHLALDRGAAELDAIEQEPRSHAVPKDQQVPPPFTAGAEPLQSLARQKVGDVLARERADHGGRCVCTGAYEPTFASQHPVVRRPTLAVGADRDHAIVVLAQPLVQEHAAPAVAAGIRADQVLGNQARQAGLHRRELAVHAPVVLQGHLVPLHVVACRGSAPHLEGLPGPGLLAR